MRTLFKISIISLFVFLAPELLFAQTSTNFAKQMPASQKKLTAKDSASIIKDSSHVYKGIIPPPQHVKRSADTSKNNSTNEQFLKRVPVQVQDEQKQQMAPPK
jgi:hypothetical protein